MDFLTNNEHKIELGLFSTDSLGATMKKRIIFIIALSLVVIIGVVKNG